MKLRGAGELSDRVTLQHPGEAQDASGYETPGWKNVKKDIAAKVIPVAGGERVRGRQIEAGIDTVVVVRFGLEKHAKYAWSQHRLLNDGLALNIVRATDDEGERKWLTCYCKSVDEA